MNLTSVSSAAPPRCAAETCREHDSAPASPAQVRLWLAHQLDVDASIHHLVGALRLEGELVDGALAAALDTVIERHEPLRTTFHASHGELHQVIHVGRRLALESVELGSGLGESDPEYQRRVRALVSEPFRLDGDLMIRAHLVRLGPASHRLLLCIHHIAADGWSLGVLVNELTRAYEAHVRREPPDLPRLGLRYREHAERQRADFAGAAQAASLQYWSRTLAGAPTTLDVSAFRAAPGRSGTGANAASCSIRISAAQTEALNASSRQASVTPFTLLAAVFSSLLGRFTGQPDVCLGTVVANRPYPESADLIGLFANTLVLRFDTGGSPTLAELLRRARRTVLGAFAHQAAPYDQVVAAVRPAGAQPASLFDVLFVFQNQPRRQPALGGISLELQPLERLDTEFPLTVSIVPMYGGLDISAEYRPSCFSGEAVVALLRSYAALLEQAPNALQRRLDELSVVEGASRDGTPRQAAPCEAAPPLVHGLFERRCDRTPTAWAFIGHAEQATYRELGRSVDQLAGYLSRLGVRPEAVVTIDLEPSFELVVAALAVLAAGGAFALLEAGALAAPAAVCAEPGGVSRITTAARLAAGASVAGRVVCVDAEREAIALEPPARQGRDISASHLAYVADAGGAFAQPHRLCIEHRGLASLLSSVGSSIFARSGGDAGDAVAAGRNNQPALLCCGSSTPEAFLIQALGALSAGGALVLASDPRALPELSPQIQLAAASLEACQGFAAPGRVDTLVVMAEAPAGALGQSAKRWGVRRWVKVYAPGAGGIVLASDDERGLDASGGAAGAVVAGSASARVLDGHANELPPGIAGELYLAGQEVARGYFGHPGISAERFVPDRVGGQPGARLFRTGRRAIQLADGRLCILEREHVAARPEAGAEGESAQAATGHQTSEPAAIAARNLTEAAVSAHFRQLLRVDELSVDDDFFARGGHSLLAIQLVSRLNHAFGVELPMSVAFERPTVAHISAALAEAGTKHWPELRGFAPRDRPRHPLSFAQQRLWINEQFKPGDPYYHVCIAVRIAGRLDISALESALTEIVRRHEPLRSVFLEDDGEPLQVVRPDVSVRVSHLTLPELPASAIEDHCRQLAERAALEPFNLEQGPLLRAQVVPIDADEHAVILTVHHIAWDGWSGSVLFRELNLLYAAYASGRTPALPPLPVGYLDYTYWQRAFASSAAFQSHLDYWLTRLTPPAPSLFPSARPGDHRAVAQRVDLGVERCRALRQLANQHGVTLFVALLTVFDLALHAETGQTDLPVVTVMAGRADGRFDDLIGCFVNNVVLRADLSGNPSLKVILGRLAQVVVEAHSHQGVPFDELLRRMPHERQEAGSLPGFCRVLFTLQNAPRAQGPAAFGAFRPLVVEQVSSPFDLVLEVTEVEESAELRVLHRTAAISDERAAGFVASYLRLLDATLAVEQSARISELTAAAR